MKTKSAIEQLAAVSIYDTKRVNAQGNDPSLHPLAAQLLGLKMVKVECGAVTWADLLLADAAKAATTPAGPELEAAVLQVAATACAWLMENRFKSEVK